MMIDNDDGDDCDDNDGSDGDDDDDVYLNELYREGHKIKFPYV
jgi:hypothetical protein